MMQNEQSAAAHVLGQELAMTRKMFNLIGRFFAKLTGRPVEGAAPKVADIYDDLSYPNEAPQRG